MQQTLESSNRMIFGRTWTRLCLAGLVLAVCSSLLGSALAGAQSIPLGADFRVDQGGSCAGGPVWVFTRTDGTVRVAWNDVQGELWSRSFDPDGAPLGPEMRLTFGAPWYRDLAGDRDGGFVALRIETGVVRAQRFDATGVSIGAEIAVSPTARVAEMPAIDVNEDGDFVVVWLDTTPGLVPSLWAARFLAAGGTLGAFLVHPEVDVLLPPDVSIVSDELGFVTTWVTAGAAPGLHDILARAYDRHGQPLDDAFPINQSTAEAHRDPRAMAFIEADVFAALWTDGDASVGHNDVVFSFSHPNNYVLTGARAGRRDQPGLAGARFGEHDLSVWRESETGFGQIMQTSDSFPLAVAPRDDTAQADPAVGVDDWGRATVAWRERSMLPGASACEQVFARRYQRYLPLFVDDAGQRHFVRALYGRLPGTFWHMYVLGPLEYDAQVAILLEHIPFAAAENADLYARVGAPPNENDFDCESAHLGEDPEHCEVQLAAGETLWLGIRAMDPGRLDYFLNLHAH